MVGLCFEQNKADLVKASKRLYMDSCRIPAEFTDIGNVLLMALWSDLGWVATHNLLLEEALSAPFLPLECTFSKQQENFLPKCFVSGIRIQQ